MNKNFKNISKEIVDDFIQSIIFVDDRAYSNISGANDLDVLKISKAFLDSGKICAVYEPKDSSDIEKIGGIASKSDVVVLDWQMKILENDDDDDVDDDVDAEDDDERGLYTKKIIEKIINSQNCNQRGTKLIIIYTGEPNLPEITKDLYLFIQNDYSDFTMGNNDENTCYITGNNVLIEIIAKPDSDFGSKYEHYSKLKNRIIEYSNLPDFIITQYASMTSGLLSNFALKSLSEIRKNSYKILSTFSDKLDIAYLSHQSLLPNVFDANELLVELIKDVLRDLLKNKKLDTFIDKEMITLWLDQNIESSEITILNTSFTRDILLLSELLFSEEKKVDVRYKNFFKGKVAKHLMKNSICLFTTEKTKKIDTDSLNTKFAILTHHKNLIGPLKHDPVLSLGTVVESSTKDYLICIQQKCDSLRIKDSRRFLFISLDVVEENEFDLITPDGVKLKVKKNSYDIRTIKFNGNNVGEVRAVLKDESYFFYSCYHDKTDCSDEFRWIFELKDLHAQRIVNSYSAQLSRIGLDESEWLRLQ